jgi:hypothetical protein
MGGGGGSGPAFNPSAIFQNMQPADTAWGTLGSNLMNFYTGQSGSSLWGGYTPAQWAQGPISQTTQNALNNPYVTGALAGATQGVTDWRLLGPSNIPGAVNTMYDLGNIAAGPADAVSSMMTNPIYGQVQSQLQTSPYLAGALSGATTGADIGQNFANWAAGQLGPVQNVAGQQGNLAGATAGLAPTLSNYGTLTAGLAPSLSNYAGAAASLAPQLQSLANQAVGPYNYLLGLGQQAAAPMGSLQSLAGTAPGYGLSLAQPAAATFAPMTAAANAILQTGFDPQNALFNRTQQQVLDQQNAINAMSGVASSPYGAGVTGQTLSNFDINWQNNLLNRQATAGSAAQGLYNQGLGGLSTASNLYNTGLNTAANLNQAAAGLGSTGAGIINTGTGMLTAGGGLLQGAGSLYGQAGNLQQGAGSLYGQAGNLQQGAGGLMNTAANVYGQIPATLLSGLNLGSTASNLAATSAQLPQNLYAQSLLQMLQPATQQAANTNYLGSALGTLANTVGGAYGQGDALTNALISGAQSVNLDPYTLYNQMQGNNFANLGQTINLGMSQFQMPETLMNLALNYLTAGTGAATAQSNIQSQQAQQQAQALGGIGSLIGGIGSLLL